MREPLLLEPVLDGLNSNMYKRFMDKIDHERFLLAPKNRKYQLAYASLDFPSTWHSIKSSFLDLLGIKLDYKDQVFVSRIQQPKLRYNIEVGTRNFAITTYNYLGISEARSHVFRRFSGKTAKYPRGFSRDGLQLNYGNILLGLLETPRGYLPVAISDNAGPMFSGFSISLIPEGPLSTKKELRDFNHILFIGEPWSTK